MTEHERAFKWREKHHLTRKQLAEAIGYSQEAIYWFEVGTTPPGRNESKSTEIKPWVWQRYKRACEGYDSELKTGGKFKW